jgi:hypothetical protein
LEPAEWDMWWDDTGVEDIEQAIKDVKDLLN